MKEVGSISVSLSNHNGAIINEEHVICAHETDIDRAFLLAKRTAKRLLKEHEGDSAREIGITMQAYRDV